MRNLCGNYAEIKASECRPTPFVIPHKINPGLGQAIAICEKHLAAGTSRYDEYFACTPVRAPPDPLLALFEHTLPEFS